jgi:alpha-beta hydrolase superfamily lysophospholipase
MKAILFGVNNPRPLNNKFPETSYRDVRLPGEDTLACWYIPSAGQSVGTIALFHGYASSKDDMLDKAMVFHDMHYDVFLADFTGSGESGGNETTIGYLEADQVKRCFDYLKADQQQKIYLFGTSMGAAAIMRAVSEKGVKPDAVILECPFGTMYKTTCARFKLMKLPAFPMAGLLVFWGGVQHGFRAFSNRPQEYARNIDCPVLLMYGAKDDKVSREETDLIFENIKGKKTLCIYPEAKHENYLKRYRNEWTEDIRAFLDANRVSD